MKEIAIYGKGGIGKSTLSANISAAMSLKKKKILQIGCDPKHDSTRLLLGGRRIETVLDYIKETGPTEYKLKDILVSGFNGIGCIEAGGPKPGVGCAGRGIITAFEFLEKFHVKGNYDYIIYDVLGDVVCGGFAVPIRREYSDTIFLVTSGEYMSLYAANNILRGIKNYDDEKCRVAGILYNSRNVKNEDKRVKAFADATSLPIFSKIPRDDIFAFAEKDGHTVVELGEEKGGKVFQIFQDIAEKIIEGPKLYPALPMTDEELEELIFYGKGKKPKPVVEEKISESSELEENVYKAGYLSKNVIRDEPLHGCGFNGAMSMSIHIRDAVVISHSPKSCTYLAYQSISSSGRRRLFERGTILPVSIAPNIVSTEMDESDMIFGGTDKLLDTVKAVKKIKPKPKAAIIVSSCPSGIIGDDVEKAKDLAEEDFPIVVVKTDGNLTGDFLQGMLMAYTEIAKQVIDKKVTPLSDVVNIVFEKPTARNTEDNFRLIKSFLDAMEIKVNCRFLSDTNFDALKNFKSARLNLLAFKDYTGYILQDFFEREYDCTFYKDQFPIGFEETSNWLRGIGQIFGKEDVAERIIEKNKKLYDERIKEIKPYLRGKKLMILTYNHQLDWILQTALDLDIEIVKICVLNFSQDEGFRTNMKEMKEILVEEKYDQNKRDQDIETFKPDILLSNYQAVSTDKDYLEDTIPMCPDNGFFSGLLMAERWKNLMNGNLEGEWKNDKAIFDKYHSR